MKKLRLVALILILPMLFACEKSEDNGLKDLFQMKTKVTAVSEKIEVEVIESEYTSGVYWIITSDDTVFENSKGKKIAKDDIKPGDTVIITYNGQIMMSYPPQTVAIKIQKQ